eukprot:TRINITY_DN1696_c0_g1_i1.p1 TRINITY_DN1696_c0_g1~~TRINITY_DN1696_c0_g1_i1.p1  ORF type:complete len:351 (-),score=76.30 TRINITY_DN1696_c0_g1_i1:97-1149(-)
MIRRPPRSTQGVSSAASDVYKRQVSTQSTWGMPKSGSESFHDFLKEREFEKYTFRKNFGPLQEYIEAVSKVEEAKFDIGIVASFYHKIPNTIISLFPQGIIVAHPSMLPLLRGPCPIEHALLQKATSTGVSILDIDAEKICGGKIFTQKPCEITPTDNYISLADKCGGLASQALMEVLEDLETARANATAQDETKITPAPQIGKREAILLWDKITSDEAITRFNAQKRSFIPAFSKAMVDGKWRTASFNDLTKEETSGEYYNNVLKPVEAFAAPGVIHWSEKGMKDKVCIRCADGWVSTSSLQIQGLRVKTAAGLITKTFDKSHYNEVKTFKFRLCKSTDLLTASEKIEL